VHLSNETEVNHKHLKKGGLKLYDLQLSGLFKASQQLIICADGSSLHTAE